MSVSKTGFIYSITIFYAIILIFTGFSGNLILKYDLDIPTPQYQDSVGDNSDYCTNYDDGKISIKRLLVPQVLRPNCVVQTTNEVVNNYTEGFEENERFGFLPSIITGFKHMPDWLTSIIFTPLAIAFLFVIITTLGGAIFDGGN